MNKLSLVGAAVLMVIPASLRAEDGCGKTPAGNIGVSLWQSGAALGFTTHGLRVDADGAPNSYRVDGKGLSFTCDGVFGLRNGVPVTQNTDPSGWQKVCQDAWAKAQQTNDYSGVKIVGFAKDANGRPLIQKDGDPLPNEAYVTTTSLTIPGTPPDTQRHYPNASEVPYVVLPSQMASQFKMALGDVLLVYRPKTGAMAFAISGDCCTAGEGSVKLHQDLKSNPIVVQDGVQRAKAGIADDMVTVMFPEHHPQPSTDSAEWNRNIQSVGQKAFSDWGGEDRLKACAG
jgi:hypothetical protein